MTLRLYTFRGRNTGTAYEATGHNIYEAARKLGIKPSLLILIQSKKTTTVLINHPFTPAKKQNSPESPTLPTKG